jgi:hypothetical protein
MDFLVICGWDDDPIDDDNLQHFDDDISADEYAQWALAQEECYDYTYVIELSSSKGANARLLSTYRRPKG